MPAGFKYNLKPLQSENELCRFETAYRLSGGFNLDITNLERGAYVPSICPLKVDFTTRTAIAVKNVRVVEAVVSGATSIKIAKDSLAYVGMHIGNGTKGATVSAVNKSNADYDVLTTTAFDAAAAAGIVLFEASAAGGTTPKNVANYLLYAATKVEPGATVTAIGQLFEIKESKLTAPVSAKDKESLGDRFMFI